MCYKTIYILLYVYSFAWLKKNNSMKYKNIIVAFILLLSTWLILNRSFDPAIIVLGVIFSGLIAFLFCRKCELFSEMNFTPKGIWYFFIYFFVFMGELFKSNFDIARRVLSPSLPINPGIVETKTTLKSKLGRMILANSITLTPGTLTIEIEDDTLFIHAVDVKSPNIEQNTKDIIRKFEKYLEVIYG